LRRGDPAQEPLPACGESKAQLQRFRRGNSADSLPNAKWRSTPRERGTAHPMTYLDYNATAPMRPEVREAMHEAHGFVLNASSVHRAGRHAKKLLEDARRNIAAAFSVFPHEVLFTGSATEANNMVLAHFCRDRPVLVGATEHVSVLKPAMRYGAAILDVDAHGLIDLAAMAAKLEALGRPALVSVMLANNETGVIQPLPEIVAIAKRYGALVHADAVQAVGKMPLDAGLLGVDMLTVGAHKVGGPVGVGALIIRGETNINPLLFGGGQEKNMRAGTENIPAILGFQALLPFLHDSAEWQRQRALRDGLEQKLNAYAHVFSANASRLPNTSLLAMPGVESATQLMHFDMAGIEISAGSACSSGRIEPSHVLLAMGVSPALAASTIRVSLGWASVQADIDAFTASWQQLFARTRHTS
jgi:cysteine desulfurase